MPCAVEGQAIHHFFLFQACLGSFHLSLCGVVLFACHNGMYTSGFKGLSEVAQSLDKRQQRQQLQVQFLFTYLNINKSIVK